MPSLFAYIFYFCCHFLPSLFFLSKKFYYPILGMPLLSDGIFYIGTALFDGTFKICRYFLTALFRQLIFRTATPALTENKVSQYDSWKVQKILAMAFDSHCKIIGYEAALPLIEKWLNSGCANVRRTVLEGLKIWTSRPYFKDHPRIAVQLLSAHKEDHSEYVRKSIGNALRDISKKYPQMISEKLK